MTRTHEDGVSTPQEVIHPSRPLEIFHQQLDRIKAGKTKRVDLVIIEKDLNDKQSVVSDLVKQQSGDGRICFDDEQIHHDLILFFQELTGEQEPLQLLWDLRRAGESIRDTSHPHHDVVTVPLDAAYADNVQLGVSVVTDESKDWAWTYYIAQAAKPKFTLAQLFRRPVHDQTSSRM